MKKNGKFAKRGIATKGMVMILALMLVVGLSVGGTLAWLTATAPTVTNTFTVGDINIDLWENDFVLSTNTLDTSKKVTAETEYKVVPGGTSPKNPTLTVKAKSENCYVYVTVENNMKIGDATVATVDVQNTWTQVATNANKTLYRYNSIVNYAENDQDLAVFTQVTYSGAEITKANISQLSGETIVINGYAHQSDNTDQATADAAAKAWAGIA